MRVIGIDPGSRRVGWGIIETGAHISRIAHIASGTLRLPDGTLAARLLALSQSLDGLLQAHSPNVSAVESVFCAKNSQSALILGHARGVVLLSLVRFGIEVFEYSATQVKQATTGSGRADKAQVQTMVHLLLGLPPERCHELDTSDALAASICHAHHHSSRASQMRHADRELTRTRQGR